ncbi:MAG: two-component regulator propeller domain-containing protein [Bacteroidia bacterium]|nr:two-component regulator propeller domain-containing protein [Bacteroidia bacterium]
MIIRVFAILFLLWTCVSLQSIAKNSIIVSPNDVRTDISRQIFNFSILDTDNGLSSNNVNCLCRDIDGIMWFGTNDGLCRYDGHEIMVFLPERDNSQAIYGKDIRGISRIGERYLRILLADGGLSVYDKLNNEFHLHEVIDEDSAACTPDDDGDTTCGMLVAGNYTYIALEDRIVCSDNKTGETETILLYRNNYYGARMDKMIKNNNYVISILTGVDGNGIALGIIDTRTNHVKEIAYKTTKNREYINDICPIDSANFYVATTNGLFVYNLHSKKLIKQEIKGVHNVMAISEGRTRGYWIAHDNSEILKWEPKSLTIKRVENASDFLNDLVEVRDLFEDKNSLLWIITSNKGVIKLDSKEPKIRSLKISSDIKGNYITHNIHGLSRDKMYAACGVYGVLKLDVDKGISERLPHSDEYPVCQVYQRRNGEIVVCTEHDIRLYADQGTTPYKIIPFPILSNEDKSLSIITKDICEDCLGNIWIATQKGLFRYNGYKCEALTNQPFWGKIIDCIYEDSEGRLWCGSNSGSYVKNIQDSLFVTTEAYKINKGANNHTHCFCEFKDQILIGTASGVLSYDKRTGAVSTAYFNKLFDNTNVYSIVSDGYEVLWLSTSSGVGYVDGNFGFEYKFDHYDGLQHFGNECKKFTKVGEHIFFGNATSISTMNANKVRLNERLAQTAVSHLLYGQSGEEEYQYMTPDSVYNVRYLLKAGLRILLASSDMSIPSRNQYAYRIDSNKEWMYLGNSNEIILSGLVPGEYKIDIRSTNSDVQWTDTYRSFKVRIIPPMWASPGALTFYSIVALILGWLLLDLRFRHVNRKMRMLAEEMRGKKTLEEQRNRLAKLHKEQTDSISYAKHIQEGIMPKADSVSHLFNKLFVLYKPKDIVSGDFCCFYHRDNLTFVIAADCTGHGVSGAFISILGIDHLSNIIMKQKINDAGKILTTLHQETYNMVFKHDSGRQNFNEGMDMTICVVHHDESYIDFAGAMNDLYMIRDNEIIAYKGDRYTIGTNTSILPDQEIIPIYQSHRVDYRRGDMFYVFSDGYVDQFGGPEQKKFKHRRFKHLLLNIHKMPARDQKVILHQRLEDWKGLNEQTDDISIIGFEP